MENTNGTEKTSLFDLLAEDEYLETEIIDIKQVTHDSYVYRCKLPEDAPLGLKLGQHLHIFAIINNEPVKRKYTPISPHDAIGYVDLLIKIYLKDTNPMYPEGGLLTQYLATLKIGDKLKIKGPHGRLIYFGNGYFEFKNKLVDKKTLVKKTYKNIGMLAGGTGIAPMYQFLESAHRKGDDGVNYTLIFANKTAKDILMAEELNEFVRAQKFNFNFYNTLSCSAPENWTEGTGYVCKEMILSKLPPPSEDTIILLCGRKAFTKLHCVKILLELGYEMENIYLF